MEQWTRAHSSVLRGRILTAVFGFGFLAVGAAIAAGCSPKVQASCADRPEQCAEQLAKVPAEVKAPARAPTGVPQPVTFHWAGFTGNTSQLEPGVRPTEVTQQLESSDAQATPGPAVPVSSVPNTQFFTSPSVGQFMFTIHTVVEGPVSFVKADSSHPVQIFQADAGNALTALRVRVGSAPDTLVVSGSGTPGWHMAIYAYPATATPAFGCSGVPDLMGDVSQLSGGVTIPGVLGTQVFANQYLDDAAGRCSLASNLASCTTPPTTRAISLAVTAPAATDAPFTPSISVVYSGDTVTASAPSAASGCPGATLSYNWTLVSKPAGSAATLSSTTAAAPFFTPDVPGGTYQLSLTLTNSAGISSTPEHAPVSVSTCGANPVSASINVGSVLKPADPYPLLATASSADGDPTKCPVRFAPTYAFAWGIPAGPPGTFSNVNSASTAFTPSTTGSYSLNVDVSDSNGQSTTALTAISVACAVPNATTKISSVAGVSYSGQNIFPGQPVVVAANVTDHCSSTPSYVFDWVLATVPSGSHAALSSKTGTTPSCTPDVAGTYAVSLVVTDQTGFSSAPANLGVLVNPVVTLSNVVFSPSLTRAGGSVMITATASDTLAAASWSAFGATGTCTTGSTGTRASCAFTVPTTTTNGSYPASVTVMDLVGSMASASGSFTVDNTPPVLSNVTLTPNLTHAGATVTLTASASKTLASATSSAFGATGTCTTGSSGANVSCPVLVPASETNGTYTVAVQVTDLAGNTSSASSAFTVDNTPPVLSNVTLTPNLTHAGATVTLTASASKTLASATSSAFGATGTCTTGSSGANVSCPIFVPASETNGTYTVAVQVTDLAGNTSSASSALTLDNTPPVLSNVTLTPNLTHAGATVTLTAVSSKTLASASSSAFAATGTCTTGSSGANVSCPVFVPTSETNGTYTVAVQVTDLAGNISSASAAFTLDNTPPVLSSLVVSPSSASPGGSVTLTATSSKPLSSASWNLFGPTGPPGTCLLDTTRQAITCAILVPTSAPAGPALVTLNVVDLAGNTAIASAAFTIL